MPYTYGHLDRASNEDFPQFIFRQNIAQWFCRFHRILWSKISIKTDCDRLNCGRSPILALELDMPRVNY